MWSPSDIRVLDNLDDVRVVADPLRRRILEVLRYQPRTVTALAEALDLPRTRLYYHINLLERHDLIAVQMSRTVSGITEKTYRTTAYRLSIDKRLLGPPTDDDTSLEDYLSVVLGGAASEIQRAVHAGLIDVEATHEDTIAPRHLLLGRRWYRLTEADVAEFSRRYGDLVREFAPKAAFLTSEGHTDEPSAEPGTLYEFLTGFYPVLPPTGDEDA